MLLELAFRRCDPEDLVLKLMWLNCQLWIAVDTDAT